MNKLLRLHGLMALCVGLAVGCATDIEPETSDEVASATEALSSPGDVVTNAGCPTGLVASGSFTATNIAGTPKIAYSVTYNKTFSNSACTGVQVTSASARIVSGGSAWWYASSLTSFQNGIGGFPTWYNCTALPRTASYGPSDMLGSVGYWFTLAVKANQNCNGLPIGHNEARGWVQLN